MSLLDFYRQHGISPVTQTGQTFSQRAALCHDLGLPPMAIRGASVLEVGPGTGERSAYLRSLQPQVYVAVEPNATARQSPEMRRIFDHVDPRPIEDFPAVEGQRFDLVWCEGLLGLSGTDSAVLLEACVRQVALGGVLVLTTIDPISNHADTLRRAQAQRLIDRTAPLADQVHILRPVFAPHLATLGAGFTRSVDDWMLDNLLNPASIGPTFSIPDACAVLDGRFELLGGSPRFLTDWRWHKQRAPWLGWVTDAYWTQCHNLYDYRLIEAPRAPQANRLLSRRCADLRMDLRAYEAGLGPPVLEPLHDPAWFGRGQQYLSLVRTA